MARIPGEREMKKKKSIDRERDAVGLFFRGRRVGVRLDFC